jgi:hypothetical protein
MQPIIPRKSRAECQLELSTKDERTVMVVVRERIVPERRRVVSKNGRLRHRCLESVLFFVRNVVFDVAVDVAIVNDFQSPKRRKIHESARAMHD